MILKLENLKDIGLSDGQIAVYSAVLELGISTLNKIQEKTGIERRNIYDILNKLIEKGFITYTLEKGKRTYQCTHPNKILEEIKRKESNLKELESKIPEMQSLFDISKPDVRAEVYRGFESMKSLLNETLDYPATYWMGGNSRVEKTNLKDWFKSWMKKRAEMKRKMYDLVSYGTFLEDLEPKDKNKHKKMYYEYRSLPKDFYTPLIIIIFGDKVAQILWNKQPFAFVMESKEVKESFMKYFNHFWK
ncbi:MAG: helix-turn-helix domain-containing protein [Nanoarchaeota archaeon]